MTISTAQGRRKRGPTSDSTAGFRPAARNIATTTSRMTLLTETAGCPASRRRAPRRRRGSRARRPDRGGADRCDGASGFSPAGGVRAGHSAVAGVLRSRGSVGSRVGEAGDHVAQRTELGDDRVATLGERSTSARSARARARPRRARWRRTSRPATCAEDTSCSASRRARVSRRSASSAAAWRWVVASAMASRARCSAASARASASATRLRVSAMALLWCSAASRVSRSFSTASARWGSWTSRWAVASACSASRRAPVRSALTSCSAASRRWDGVALGGGEQVGGLGLGRGRRLLDLAHRRGACLVELLELDHPHVLGVAGGVRLHRGGVGARRAEDLVGAVLGRGDDLVGLLLGQAEQLAGPAAEPGVRRVSFSLACSRSVASCFSSLGETLAGCLEARREARRSPGQLAELAVHRSGVVAAATDREAAGGPRGLDARGGGRGAAPRARACSAGAARRRRAWPARRREAWWSRCCRRLVEDGKSGALGHGRIPRFVLAFPGLVGREPFPSVTDPRRKAPPADACLIGVSVENANVPTTGHPAGTAGRTVAGTRVARGSGASVPQMPRNG